ncbi:MAG TPA: MerR family transcriptional regulator [Casimicrobiaceae bacterium]
MPADKDPGALLTIGELSEQLGVAQHILRYWESRFPQLKPMQRAGNRRYYRPADVELVQRINRLLNQEGYTVRGVQKLLREKDNSADDVQSDFAAAVSTAQQASTVMPNHEEPIGVDVFRLIALRNRLSDALDS